MCSFFILNTINLSENLRPNTFQLLNTPKIKIYYARWSIQFKRVKTHPEYFQRFSFITLIGLRHLQTAMELKEKG